MQNTELCFIVGLGNPGGKYVHTRHNAGFMIIDKLSDTFSIPLDKKKFNVLAGSGLIEGSRVVLAKPLSFMNACGDPIRKTAAFYSISSRQMLIIHDDIDLDFGRTKIKDNGGHGGHNGIRSLMEAFGGGDFVRLRIGIGRSDSEKGVVGHVLGQFNDREEALLDQILQRAHDAVVTMLRKDVKSGMNLFNRKILI
ncbi:MAG: aminoacyl-tRNA hydrolase [Desulfobacterales bacterium]|nr:aminoacyl-tRNA hydrolase [Desulfobacterales bacterium]